MKQFSSMRYEPIRAFVDVLKGCVIVVNWMNGVNSIGVANLPRLESEQAFRNIFL